MLSKLKQLQLEIDQAKIDKRDNSPITEGNTLKYQEADDTISRCRKEMREIILNAEFEETLRDKFAGQAMQGIMSYDSSVQHHGNTVAEWAYGIADAMLKQREL